MRSSSDLIMALPAHILGQQFPRAPSAAQNSPLKAGNRRGLPDDHQRRLDRVQRNGCSGRYVGATLADPA